MCQFSCLNLNILGRESAFIHLINFIDDSPYYLLTRCLNSFPQKQFYSFLLFCQDRVLSRPWFVAIFVGISFFRVSPLSASLNLRLQASQTHFKGNIWWRVKSRSDAKCWCCWLNSASLKFCPEIAKCKLQFFFYPIKVLLSVKEFSAIDRSANFKWHHSFNTAFLCQVRWHWLKLCLEFVGNDFASL